VIIVAGKGGVGKTTVSATIARMAASEGLRTLVIDVEGSGAVGALFGAEQLDYEPVVLVPEGPGTAEIAGRALVPDQALAEYLDDHGLRRVLRRVLSTGALDLVATAAPGLKDILVLGKVKQIERSGEYDLVVVDAPAAGHAITFLSAAAALMEVVRVGPVRAQAAAVLELLGDPDRCSVVLVTLPEETPVNELVETAFSLEDKVGVKLGPVVVNGLYPTLVGLRPDHPDEALAAAARFRLARAAQQDEQVARLRSLLPLPQLHLPYIFEPALGSDDIGRLVAALSVDTR
jgi:anion-transporting  ArsA/GET3 family ATPase